MSLELCVQLSFSICFGRYSGSLEVCFLQDRDSFTQVFIYSFLVGGVGLGFELRALCLQSRVCTG
jgi:hypothetical protein